MKQKSKYLRGWANPDELLMEEIAKYWADPLGYVMFAFPWSTDNNIQMVKLKEPYASRFECEWGPDLWACEFLDELGEEIKKRRFDGKTSVAPVRFSTASGHGIGKALHCDDWVSSPDGLKKVEDVVPGDTLFGEEGQPVKVKATQSHSQVPFYKVTFDDRSSVEVSSGHLWKVKGRQQRRNYQDWIVVSTQELLDMGVKRPNGVSLARQWEIPSQQPVSYPELSVDIDPYTYGVWLGDGHKKGGRVTNIDKEVWENIPYELSKARKGVRTVYGLQTKLKQFGLFGCSTYTASVDRRFIESQSRLEVLQGLLDTDGWVETCGAAGFASASRQLTRDVIEMARSLGLKARAEKFQKNLHAGSWRTLITWDGKSNLFRIPRKQNKLIAAASRYQKRWIDKIEYVGLKDGVCFEVDYGLFLTKDYHVTHNSTLVSWLIKFILDTRPFSKGVVTANTSDQLRTKTWAELAKWNALSISAHKWQYTSGRGAMSLYRNSDSKDVRQNWKCDAMTCREENAEAFQGLHAASSTPFYIFDEASGIPDAIYEARSGGATDGEPMWFDFGNPTRKSGMFFENCIGQFSHRFSSRTIDSRSVAITNKALMQEWADDWGEDSDFFKVKVKGEFPSAGSVQFISTDMVQDAMRRNKESSSFDQLTIGVDVARYGDNSTVIFPKFGNDARSFPYSTYKGLDTVQVVEKVIEVINEFKLLGKNCQGLFVDGGGLGGGVVDMLRRLGYNPIDVNFGGKSSSPKYQVKSDEMWGRLRESLPKLILPNDQTLLTQLTQREYGFSSASGKIRLESKDAMMKRGVPSPDVADALALNFAYTPEVEAPSIERQLGISVLHDYDPLEMKD